eukprot:COSAG06_NODE_430_length_15870_cov_101.914971_5_plen_129_part_00
MVRTVFALDPLVLQLLQQPQVVPSARTLTSTVAACRVCRRSQAAARTQSVNDETTGDRQPDPTAVQAIYLRLVGCSPARTGEPQRRNRLSELGAFFLRLLLVLSKHILQHLLKVLVVFIVLLFGKHML